MTKVIFEICFSPPPPFPRFEEKFPMRRTREAEQIFLLCKTDLTRTRMEEFRFGRQR